MRSVLCAVAACLAVFPAMAAAQASLNACSPAGAVCLDLLDLDGSGALDQQEIAHYMGESQDTTLAAGSLLDTYDNNGDRLIGLEEFVPGIIDALDPISSTPSYDL